MDTNAPVVLVNVWNRPIYLWACLDALYRLTKTPARFIVVDNASDDPLVAEVLKGFERRGMIDQVVTLPGNDPALLAEYVTSSLPDWGPFFAYVEADAVLADRPGCWLADMIGEMQRDPQLAMLGTLIDKRDFIDIADARALADGVPDDILMKQVKAASPEREQDVREAGGAKVFRPHNPAGRFVLLRTAAVQRVGIGDDAHLDRKLRAAGYTTGIITTVVHRHLSLLHLFDQRDYDVRARESFMSSFDVPAA